MSGCLLSSSPTLPTSRHGTTLLTVPNSLVATKAASPTFPQSVHLINHFDKGSSPKRKRGTSIHSAGLSLSSSPRRPLSPLAPPSSISPTSRSFKRVRLSRKQVTLVISPTDQSSFNFGLTVSDKGKGILIRKVLTRIPKSCTATYLHSRHRGPDINPKMSNSQPSSPPAEYQLNSSSDSLKSAEEGVSKVHLDDDFAQPDHTAMFSSSPAASPSASPHSLPAFLTMKRPKPTRLQLALPIPPSASAGPSTSSSLTATPLTPSEAFSSKDNTPYTPGPPKTPALAMNGISTMSMGRASAKGGLRRPSLLSLITQPPTGNDDVPPTPGGYPRSRSHPAPPAIRPERLRGHSYNEVLGQFSQLQPEVKSAVPVFAPFTSVDEQNDQNTYGLTRSTPTSLSTSRSSSADTSSTPESVTSEASSPPLPTSSTFPAHSTYPDYNSRCKEPYEDGPVELIPGVFLGAEEATSEFSWAGSSRLVRVMNVAQEIDDPFAPPSETNMVVLEDVSKGDFKGKGKERVNLACYTGLQGRPAIEYCHLLWSHGEAGLADLPANARLQELLEHEPLNHHDADADTWGFWHAIRWLEEARTRDVPVLVHCQCGVSRSATLAVAYIMTLAASGRMPATLGHLKGMQDTYDFVKRRSPWVGPNVSLVFQLIEYQRNLTSLISSHLLTTSIPLQTSFPKLEDDVLSEEEWARKRREFDDSQPDDMREERRGHSQLGSPMTPEQAGDEAKLWDAVMLQRRRARA